MPLADWPSQEERTMAWWSLKPSSGPRTMKVDRAVRAAAAAGGPDWGSRTKEMSSPDARTSVSHGASTTRAG
jgi:hypothetical protein